VRCDAKRCGKMGCGWGCLSTVGPGSAGPSTRSEGFLLLIEGSLGSMTDVEGEDEDERVGRCVGCGVVRVLVAIVAKRLKQGPSHQD
jgi:hypothetical protein